MKYLIFTFLFIFSGSILTAQDTLYVKGKKQPLLVNIVIVKKKTLNYMKLGSVGLRTISLKKIKKIQFGDETKIEEQESSQERSQEIFVVKKAEKRSTVLLQSSGVIFTQQAGISYMHRISPAITPKVSYWVHAGGGYHAQRGLRRNTEGSYLEFGVRAELASKKNPRNRFHMGLDINNQWAKGTEVAQLALFPNEAPSPVDDSRIAFQIPIGYTFRGEKGFYTSAGLEISTYSLLPAIFVGMGYTFGN